MLNYVFAGSPDFASVILEELCLSYQSPSLIITQPAKAAGRGKKETPTAVETFARQKGLKFIACPNINSDEMLTQLKNLQPDLLFVAAFGQILKEGTLKIPKLFCMNVHASLLPKYRGAAPIQWALMKGESETGVSFQRMVKALDAGDVLFQKNLAINPLDTSLELYTKLAKLAAHASVQVMQLIEKGNYSFTPQNPAFISFAPKIEKSFAWINWNQKASEILNQIRALQPWPVAQCLMGTEKLKVYRAFLVSGLCSGNRNQKPGDISTDHKSYLQVQCGDGGALSLTEIQLENRKKLEIADFLRGFRGTFPFQFLGTINS